jgi:hypothetical protein
VNSNDAREENEMVIDLGRQIFIGSSLPSTVIRHGMVRVLNVDY